MDCIHVDLPAPECEYTYQESMDRSIDDINSAHTELQFEPVVTNEISYSPDSSGLACFSPDVPSTKTADDQQNPLPAAYEAEAKNDSANLTELNAYNCQKQIPIAPAQPSNQLWQMNLTASSIYKECELTITEPRISTFDFRRIETVVSDPVPAKTSPELPQGAENPATEINVLKRLAIDDIFGSALLNEVEKGDFKVGVHETRHGAYTVNGKCQKRTARRYGKQRRKSFSKQKVGPKIRKERKIPVIQTMQVSRPPTPLTPSLDPELLRKFEEEDRPKRVLRPSTVAATNNSHKNELQIKYAKATRAKKKMNHRVMNGRITKNTIEQRVKDSKSSRNGRKRVRSEGDQGTKPKKRVKANIDALLDPGLLSSSSDLNMASTSDSIFGVNNSANINETLSPETLQPVSLRRRSRYRRRKSGHLSTNWKVYGHPYRQYIYINNDNAPVRGICYPEAQHLKSGVSLRVRDSVRVNSVDGESNYGRIARIFISSSGVPTATVLWYYCEDQVKADRLSINPPIATRELLASRHLDVIPLDTIDEIIRVLTYNEYARYMAESTNDAYPPGQRVLEKDLVWSRGEDDYRRRQFLPCDDTPFEQVYFCRRIYDFKQRKINTTKPALPRKTNSNGKRNINR